MYVIDINIFHLSCHELIAYVQTEQAGKIDHPDLVRFDRGWFKEQEWYKREVWEKAQEILQYQSWKKDDLQAYDLIGRIVKCMNIKLRGVGKNNLINWRESAENGGSSLKVLLYKTKEISEDIIYQIFCGENEEAAFNNALLVWGEKYPLLSFLFFLKDIKRFVPVRPTIMTTRLMQLGIEADCLKTCSWKNYQEFIQILKRMQDLLNEEIPHTELIDAHSFLWAMWVFETQKPEPASSPESIQEKDMRSATTIFGDDRDAIVKVRINQDEFRKRLLKRYKGCCLCGVSNPELLVASHIQPWSMSSKREKVDDENGLLLCPNHDKLFDRGFITFSDEGEIIISDKLSKKDRALMNVPTIKQITLSSLAQKYMQFHRKNIFKISIR